MEAEHSKGATNVEAEAGAKVEVRAEAKVELKAEAAVEVAKRVSFAETKVSSIRKELIGKEEEVIE